MHRSLRLRRPPLRSLCQTLVILFAVLPAATVLNAAPPSSSNATSGSYKVGERLPAASAPTSGIRQIKWDDLYPKNWDPYASIKGMDFSRMSDADPRATEALARVRTALNDAPVINDLNGVTVRIPGFLIPLDADKDEVRNFLLVPYFGACIHTPPPPANQIIDVRPGKPVKARMMDAIWVTGKLQTVRTDSPFGAAGYRIVEQSVEPYVASREAASSAATRTPSRR